MDDKKLAGKLREISRSTSSSYKKQIFKQAAKRIEEQAALLEKTKELLSLLGEKLPKMDCGCDLCDHSAPMKPCFDKDELIQCAECPYGCYCQDCGPEGEKWENSVLNEVLQNLKRGLSDGR